jgi:hypothetical protein
VPVVRAALDALSERGAPVALVTAGWEEREAEDREFQDHVARPVTNLGIWERVERIFAADPELLAAMRQRHDTLRTAQELYRLRLQGLVVAAAALQRRAGEGALAGAELEAALAMLQQLDREHVARVDAIHAEFDAHWRPQGRPAVAEQRAAIASLLQGTAALCIAGGHVGVLLHRLRLFDVLRAGARLPIVAWSAGAMVLGERIVLFRRDADGGVDAEVMEAGLRVTSGIVPLPHARRRLDLGDEASLGLLARRLLPDACVPLDDGQRIDGDGRRWTPASGTRRLGTDGRLAEASA